MIQTSLSVGLATFAVAYYISRRDDLTGPLPSVYGGLFNWVRAFLKLIRFGSIVECIYCFTPWVALVMLAMVLPSDTKLGEAIVTYFTSVGVALTLALAENYFYE